MMEFLMVILKALGLVVFVASIPEIVFLVLSALRLNKKSAIVRKDEVASRMRTLSILHYVAALIPVLSIPATYFFPGVNVIICIVAVVLFLAMSIVLGICDTRYRVTHILGPVLIILAIVGALVMIAMWYIITVKFGFRLF